ncbi:hypothetical protein LDVICp138 [lymphocystis disease virus-China]|uniref:Uncharacterized protein n=1 Tax=lymphocystis disease virus-China TaxID=256729 RepID=Q677X4_9VIRU|nr:hypothetical protein LDVICp138 [lymphocystis disease virus-China]AAU10983.1 hypothetical protein [lymphocystis disease virus-China]
MRLFNIIKLDILSFMMFILIFNPLTLKLYVSEVNKYSLNINPLNLKA